MFLREALRGQANFLAQANGLGYRYVKELAEGFWSAARIAAFLFSGDREGRIFRKNTKAAILAALQKPSAIASIP